MAAYQKPIEFDKFLSLIAKVVAARRMREPQPAVSLTGAGWAIKKKELCN